ncbi:MAG: cupin domain-containing protein [Ruminococcus sp.]|nr:cupin domain-containing protein [Ruminococcus sp.]
MNIVLLSGGSGKRLWPLSNDIRSKQFIKMFKNKDDEYESMVQRVYRQIKEADPDASITIATSKKQVSAIHNQLSDDVSVCVEPARRDTFPAIVLAAAYMKSEKHVADDDVIIVCPVDPYVNSDYFESFLELNEMALNGSQNLTLMGIEPTYPSEKYGYIMPLSKDRKSDVAYFIEKPNEADAKKYIEQGALWNGGIFAFKLGYMLDIARQHIDFETYQDVFKNYDKLKKISFDYEVVEKEKAIKVMRFSGQWKDIGSWNTFSEEMHGNVIGKAVLSEGCKNTNVVNELDIPVLCMGCRNMIIAASNDGILVSDKEKSSYMKSYVNEFDQQVMYAEKSWGSYTVLDVQDNSMTVRIELMPGNRLYYHSHKFRDEVWNVIAGSGKVIIDGEERLVHAGDIITLKAGCKHTAIAKTELKIIEVQIGPEIDVNDKEKFQL